MTDLKNKRFITVAPTGAYPNKKHNPNVPLQPKEIAESVYESWKAGAAMAHIHVRNDEGQAAMDFDKFEETVRLIRSHKDCDIILNLTSSGGLGYTEEERIRPFYELKPELASFDAGTMNWQNNTVFENSPSFLEKLGLSMLEVDVKPEIEVFDAGMIYNADYGYKKGYLKGNPHFQFVLGAAGGLPATTKNLLFLLETARSLYPNCTWSALGIGRGQMEIMYSTIALGGNIRVGMEDNVSYHYHVPAKSNAQFVERAARLIKEYGLEVATPDEARQILGLKK